MIFLVFISNDILPSKIPAEFARLCIELGKCMLIELNRLIELLSFDFLRQHKQLTNTNITFDFLLSSLYF